MGTSSEDVLLMVNYVRHKKNDGTLYMMAERVAWMLEGKDTFSISHKYADIKMQKISPDGKPKVQLQVVLHSGDTTTFHFVNPMGVESQLKDRNDVKELLQQLLPKFKRKVDKELEEKNKILSEDPILFQLYRDLVMSHVITSEEFWANYAKQNKKIEAKNAQDVGVSAAFLSDINPQADGSNGIKYNVTAEIIDSIFKTYPAVKRKHMENVPHKMSESEFWTKFFQSHYFHRDHLNLGPKDLFSECAKNDEQEVQLAIKEKIRDPFVDIKSFSDNVLDDIYSEQATTDSKSSTSGINQSVIKRFNHHSMMVLQSCSGKKSELLEQQNCTMPGLHKPNGVIMAKHAPKAPQDNETDSEKSVKKARLEEMLEYEDLQGDSRFNVPALNLEKRDRYFHGPTPVSDSEYISPEGILLASDQLNAAIENWAPNLPNVLTPSAATLALGELLPGGTLMKNLDGTSLKDTVPVEIQSELKQLYISLAELLRHFWSCFPTTSPQLEEKVVRMHDTLQRFQFAKLERFKDKLAKFHVPLDLADHLMGLLEAAYKKFSPWQSRLTKNLAF